MSDQLTRLGTQPTNNAGPLYSCSFDLHPRRVAGVKCEGPEMKTPEVSQTRAAGLGFGLPLIEGLVC